jgi:hypothetical protein
MPAETIVEIRAGVIFILRLRRYWKYKTGNSADADIASAHPYFRIN